MLKTTRRPAAASPGGGQLPAGAVRWARTWLDQAGRPRTSDREVPVDAADRRTAHVLHTCPGRIEVKDDAGQWTKGPCDQQVWMLPGDRPRYCPDHGARLEPDERREPWLPWTRICRDLTPTVGVPAAAGLSVGAVGWLAADVPLWALPPGTAVAAAAAYAGTRWWLIRKAIRSGRIDAASEVTGRRKRETISRRARTAGYCTTAAGLWVAAASTMGFDPATFGGALTWASLAALTAAGSYPWRRHVLQLRDRPPAPVVNLPVPQAGDPVEAEARHVWETRVGVSGGALPATSLADFRHITGGWTATIVPDVPGAIDPERFEQAHVVRRIAGAYRLPVTDVTIEMNAGDAATAMIRVQHESPLYDTRIWPGPETCDWDAGVMRVGWYADDTPAWYRWWNTGGPWHELISGCTGSGKSEFVQMLLLASLRGGGRVLDRVVDPQAGQSFGLLQDHVDWFAPHLPEAQMLLLDTVKEMRRRNRVLSRRRQKTWRCAPDMPLIVVTIDEAHQVLSDPICLALVEQLAKMARKCGIKLRIITQVASVTEIGNSTPIKDALLAGQRVLFRTGSPVSSHLALGGTLDVEPHKLPAEWPNGSPRAGDPTAGVGWMVGTARRSMPLRMYYTGREEDLPGWLYHKNELIITPGAPSADMVAESGPLWGRRKERIAAFFDSPPDDGDILPGELVASLVARAAGTKRSMPAAAQPAGGGDMPARDLVLRAAVACADHTGRVDRETLAVRVRGGDGKPMPPRTLSKALTDLIEAGLLRRVRNGVYEVDEKGRAACKAEVDEAVEGMLEAAEGRR